MGSSTAGIMSSLENGFEHRLGLSACDFIDVKSDTPHIDFHRSVHHTYVDGRSIANIIWDELTTQNQRYEYIKRAKETSPNLDSIDEGIIEKAQSLAASDCLANKTLLQAFIAQHLLPCIQSERDKLALAAHLCEKFTTDGLLSPIGSAVNLMLKDKTSGRYVTAPSIQNPREDDPDRWDTIPAISKEVHIRCTSSGFILQEDCEFQALMPTPELTSSDPNANESPYVLPDSEQRPYVINATGKVEVKIHDGKINVAVRDDYMSFGNAQVAKMCGYPTTVRQWLRQTLATIFPWLKKTAPYRPYDIKQREQPVKILGSQVSSEEPAHLSSLSCRFLAQRNPRVSQLFSSETPNRYTTALTC